MHKLSSDFIGVKIIGQRKYYEKCWPEHCWLPNVASMFSKVVIYRKSGEIQSSIPGIVNMHSWLKKVLYC